MTWWIGSNARCGRGQRGRYWGAFQYVPRSKLVCTGADSNSAVRAFVGYDADALERWRTAEPRDQEREYSPFDVRVAFDGLRRHQLRSCPLNVCGKVSAQVLTMRWILTASVLAAAAIGMTIGVSIRSRRTDPGTVARASRRVFSRLDPHGRRHTTEFSNH